MRTHEYPGTLLTVNRNQPLGGCFACCSEPLLQDLRHDSQASHGRGDCCLRIDLCNACARGTTPSTPVNAPETVSIPNTFHPTTLRRGPASTLHTLRVHV